MEPQPGIAARVLHVFVLSAFALAQPIFDLLERNSEFLVAHRVDSVDLVLIAAALVLGVPAVLVAMAESLQRWIPRGARAIHLALVAALSAAIALPPIERAIPELPGLALGSAGAAGLVFATAYARLAVVRTFLTVLSLALVAFPSLFFMSEPIARLRAPAPAAAAPAQVEHAVPVVMVILDALPLSSLLDESDEIDARRTPHLAALANDSHWFRNATTVATYTRFAVPALLTGRYPVSYREPTAAEHPQNLFTLLATSHDLNVVEPNTHLCPAHVCGPDPLVQSRGARLAAVGSDLFIVLQHLLLPGRFGDSLPAVDSTWRDFAANRETGSVAWQQQVRDHRFDPHWILERFLARVRKGPRPGLHFLHLPVPHSPYRHLPSGNRYRHSPRAYLSFTRQQGGKEVVDEWAVTQRLQAHLLQVGYADTLLGRIVEHLKREALYDSSIIVVVSDHGVSLRPGVPTRTLARAGENAAAILPVPLLVKLPGQRAGTVSDRNVETVDVLPTILAVLEAESPEPIDGSSLLDPGRPERPHKLVSLEVPAFEVGQRSGAGGERARLRRRTFGPTIPGQRELVRSLHERFDLELGSRGLLRIGPHRGLLGRPVAELPVAAESSFQLVLRNPDDYDAVDPDSGFVPANVAGTIDGPDVADSPLELAVALNGTVQAVTRTLALKDGVAPFTAMLPDHVFRAGENRIDVFVIPGGAQAVTLTPARSETADPGATAGGRTH